MPSENSLSGVGVRLPVLPSHSHFKTHGASRYLRADIFTRVFTPKLGDRDRRQCSRYRRAAISEVMAFSGHCHSEQRHFQAARFPSYATSELGCQGLTPLAEWPNELTTPASVSPLSFALKYYYTLSYVIVTFGHVNTVRLPQPGRAVAAGIERHHGQGTAKTEMMSGANTTSTTRTEET